MAWTLVIFLGLGWAPTMSVSGIASKAACEKLAADILTQFPQAHGPHCLQYEAAGVTK